MKVITSSLIILFFGLPGYARDSVGNHGDLVKHIFESGRFKAINMLLRLDSCSLPAYTDPKIRAWILEHKFELIDDIRETKHDWDPKYPKNKTDKCAWTDDYSNDPIEFSTIKCSGKFKDEATAAALLIHESTHHFQKDEDFSVAVANVVLASTGNYTCSGDPFQPDSCKFKPMDFTPKLSNSFTMDFESIGSATLEKPWELYSRSRTCKSATQCTDWEQNKSTTRTFFDSKGNSHILPSSGKVILTVAQNGRYNEIYLRTLGERECLQHHKYTTCTMGLGPSVEHDLYDYFNGERQKLTFVSTFTNKCIRQHAKLVFRKSGAQDWTETEHVIFSAE